MFASDDPHNPANNWRVYAYFREPNGTDGFEYLDLQSGLPLNAGLVVQDCGQCTSPSIKVRVLAMNLNDSTDRIWVLDKDNSNTARSLVDQWSPLPRPSQEDFSIMRLPFGYGGDLGQIYSSDVRGHLREYAPASGVWLDRMFPGGPVLSAVSGADGNLQVFTTTKWEQYFALMNWQDSNSGNWGNFDTVQFSPAGNTLAYSTVVGAIGALGVLNFVGIDKATNKAALIATQTPDHYWHGAGTLLPGQTVTLKALAAEVNTGGLLQVVGISNSDKRAYHVGRQSPVGWQSPGTLLPGQTANLTAITAARGNSNFLQVLGLGEDGMAYLVAWQDGSSNWHPGFIMPGQTPPLAAISVVRGNGGTLQLIGLTTTGVAYLVAWQDSGGTWNSGFVLPAPSVLMSTITTQVGAGGAHVIGLGAFDGLPYLVSSQDGNGNWNAGFQLPSAGVPLSGLTVGRGANSTLQVLGLGSDELIYQASVEEVDSSWHAGAGLLP
jgi:hypothetical protein